MHFQCRAKCLWVWDKFTWTKLFFGSLWYHFSWVLLTLTWTFAHTPTTGTPRCEPMNSNRCCDWIFFCACYQDFSWGCAATTKVPSFILALASWYLSTWRDFRGPRSIIWVRLVIRLHGLPGKAPHLGHFTRARTMYRGKILCHLPNITPRLFFLLFFPSYSLFFSSFFSLLLSYS